MRIINHVLSKTFFLCISRCHVTRITTLPIRLLLFSAFSFARDTTKSEVIEIFCYAEP